MILDWDPFFEIENFIIMGWPKNLSGFFVRYYGKTQKKILASPIFIQGFYVMVG